MILMTIMGEGGLKKMFGTTCTVCPIPYMAVKELVRRVTYRPKEAYPAL